MPTQTQLFPDPPDPPGGGVTPPPPAADRQARPAHGNPVWMQRISLFILVLFCVYLGVFVTVLPWYGPVWDHNLFFTSHPLLWSVLRLGAVRGFISGLGLLDIWIGISEAIHYRDHRK